MAIDTYIAREGQDIFDLAMLLYGSTKGVNDLITRNGITDLDAEDYQGTSIQYDTGLVFTEAVQPIEIPKPTEVVWRSLEGQNIYDLGLEVFGNLDNLGEIFAQNELAGNDIFEPSNTWIFSLSDDPRREQYRAQGVRIATTEIEFTGGIEYLLKESGDFLLLEVGDLIELD